MFLFCPLKPTLIKYYQYINTVFLLPCLLYAGAIYNRWRRTTCSRRCSRFTPWPTRSRLRRCSRSVSPPHFIPPPPPPNSDGDEMLSRFCSARAFLPCMTSKPSGSPGRTVLWVRDAIRVCELAACPFFCVYFLWAFCFCLVFFLQDARHASRPCG